MFIQKINDFINRYNTTYFMFSSSIQKTMNMSALIFLGFAIILFSSTLTNINAVDMSPRKQMNSGISAENVSCKIGMTLMIRTTTGAAACVFPNSSIILSETGWGIIIKSASENTGTQIPKNDQTNNEISTSDPELIRIKINDGVGSKDR